MERVPVIPVHRADGQPVRVGELRGTGAALTDAWIWSRRFREVLLAELGDDSKSHMPHESFITSRTLSHRPK